MRHDLLLPSTSSLLPCVHIPSNIDGDIGSWAPACSSPELAAPMPSDLLEAGVHAHNLAVGWLDWDLPVTLVDLEPSLAPPSPAKTESSLSQTLSPESPSCVALAADLEFPMPLFPPQTCTTHYDFDRGLLDDISALSSVADVNCLLDADIVDENDVAETAKRELFICFQASRDADPPQLSSFSRSSAANASGMERLRKRQRGYEQKYRKKKRINFKHMRREWLHLEALLSALQIQHADAVASLPAEATLQERIAQLRREEKALARDRVLRRTATRWVEFFRIQLQVEGSEPGHHPRFPTYRSEWNALIDNATGIGACLPFVPPSFRFSWD